MQKVKINRDTIKRNEDYGIPFFKRPGKRTIQFEWIGDIPKNILNNRLFIVAETNFSETIKRRGFIYDFELAEQLNRMKIPGLEISIKVEEVVIDNTFASKYLYEYLPTMVQCSECELGIDVNQIEIDVEDDGTETTERPICKGMGTFPEFEYENINDVIKEL
jgi:hypothetical protein